MGDDSECAPARGGTILNARRVRFAHIQRKDYLYFAFVALCGALQTHFHGWGRSRERHLQRLLPAEAAALRGTNSLSQSLTALTAPSGREPLAKPRTLRLSREVYRHAKGPIPEGAVAVGDWGSLLPGVTPSGANAPAPPRGRLSALPQSFPPPLKPSPWGRWHRRRR